MKSRTFRTLMCISVLTLFAAVLAIPVSLAAQQDKPKHHKYKVIVIGTFGGSFSGLSNPLPAENLLNKRGKTVMGLAATTTADPYYPNCFVGECLVSHAFQWRHGVLTDLGALPGVNSSYAFSINNHGQIVGDSENGSIDPLTGYPEVDAVLWKGGAIKDLGTFGGNASTASTLNDHGQVVGGALNTTSDPYANLLGPPSVAILYFPVAQQEHAFLWQNDKMGDLGTLGGPDSVATAVNNMGQVAGESYTNDVKNQGTGIPTEHAFFWEKGTMTDIPTLGGTVGYTNWMNDHGQVVGTSNLKGDVYHHAFSWIKGRRLKNLRTLGGNNSEAWWVNDAGEVAGWADISTTSTAHHPFLWKNGVMKDLGTLYSDPCGVAQGVNSRDQVVGQSFTACAGNSSSRGWLWENGGPIVDLTTLLIPGSGITTVRNADAINDRGEIVGLGTLSDGEGRVILLIPK